jgi:aspartyl-tRNA(Asn)/glutamyl-tRNA(Gln) amidotransferase subunit A
MELWELGVGQLERAYAGRECSPVEVVDALLGHLERRDPQLGAFRQVLSDPAREEAARMTAELAAGRSRGPLHGVPFAVKELIDVGGAAGCCGSKVLAGRISPRDAEVVHRLRAVGAIVVGVTRSHEFGWGITTQHAELGSTLNPWDPSLVPGGSSGGSAVAVAAGMVPFALGTDAGGSIRIPASCCGVVGLKPTFGRLATQGIIPLAPSLDHIGLLAREAADVAIALRALADYEPGDPPMPPGPFPPLPPSWDESLEGTRVGFLPGLHLTPLAPDAERVFLAALAAAEAGGAAVQETAVEHPERIRPAFAAIQMAEAYHIHARTLGTYPGRAADYGADVRERLELAETVSLGEYLSARDESLLIRRRFQAVFAGVDVLLTPVMAGPPSPIADPDRVMHRGAVIPFRDLVMPYTVPQNLTGLPACVVPAGWDGGGVPIGVQVTAPWGREDLALRVGAALHRSLGLVGIWPPPATGGARPFPAS